MLTQHELLSVFLGRAAHVAGEKMYFDPEVALELLGLCEQNNLAMAHMEGFALNDVSLLPQRDMSADSLAGKQKSWRGFRDACNREARNFLEHLPARDNLVLSLMLLSRSDWKDR